MKKLNVVITSGGTREAIDSVRVLSNISSGRLGATIANEFLKHGHEVTYVASKNSIMPASYFTGEYSFIATKDTDSVMETMQECVPKADVVIQAIAVSDFTFDLEESIKLSSGSPEAFIEHMRKTIVKTPKIISKFRGWNPDAILVGFKFTVGKSGAELVHIANELMKDNKLNMVLANDKSQMQKAGEHTAVLITDVKGVEQPWHQNLRSKKEIADTMYDNVVMLMGQKG